MLGAATDSLNVAVGGGVFTMLAALFTILLKTYREAGDTADARYKAEIDRLQAEKKDMVVNHRAEMEASRAEAAMYRDRYETLIERMAPPGLIEDAAAPPVVPPRRRRRTEP